MSKQEYKDRVVIIDDEEGIRSALSRFFVRRGFDVESAGKAMEGLELIKSYKPDAVLLDINLPDKDGFYVLNQLRNENNILPVIMLTGEGTRKIRLESYRNMVTDFVEKPPDLKELVIRVKGLIDHKNIAGELEEAKKILFTMAKTIEARDKYTSGHSERVTNYSVKLAQKIGLDQETVETVKKGAMLHDLGKVAIRDSVLLKKGKLSPDEYNHIKEHPVIGKNLLEHLNSFREALPIIYSHHEKLDGTGYPKGLSGDQIPLVAKIVSVADIYDALSTTRPYRNSFRPNKSLKILNQESDNGKLDKNLVKQFSELIEKITE